MKKVDEQTPLVFKPSAPKYCFAYAFAMVSAVLIGGSVYFMTSNEKHGLYIHSSDMYLDKKTDFNTTHIRTVRTSVSFAETKETITEQEEVSIILSPDDVFHLEFLDSFGSDDEWMDYHHLIVRSHGHEPGDASKRFAFTMYDFKFDKEYYWAKYGFDESTFAEDDKDKTVEAYHHDGQDFEHAGHDHHNDSMPSNAPTPKPLRPIQSRTPRPIVQRTPRPVITRTPRPVITRTPRTGRPTILRNRTQRPTVGRTPRPSILRTPRPTINRTPRPTILRTPRPTRDAQQSSKISTGGFECYFRYSFLEIKNTENHVLRCNEGDGSIMVGCVGGSTHRPKNKRSGELATDDGCVVNGETIYIRCCKPDKDYDHHELFGVTSKVEYEANKKWPTYTLDGFCQLTTLDGFAAEDSNLYSEEHDHSAMSNQQDDGGHDMHNNHGSNGGDTDHDGAQHFHDEDHVNSGDDELILVGCTGWTGTESGFDSSLGTATNTMAEQIIGTKIVENKFTKDTNCKAHRADSGFIAASGIAIGIESKGHASIDCVTVESKSSRIPHLIASRNAAINGKEEPVFGSMVFCPEDYNLMDCSGYNEASMKDCFVEYTGDDKVNAAVYHGADLACMSERGAHCSSSGYTDEIRVQAVCCKLIHP